MTNKKKTTTSAVLDEGDVAPGGDSAPSGDRLFAAIWKRAGRLVMESVAPSLDLRTYFCAIELKDEDRNLLAGLRLHPSADLMDDWDGKPGAWLISAWFEPEGKSVHSVVPIGDLDDATFLACGEKAASIHLRVHVGRDVSITMTPRGEMPKGMPGMVRPKG